jgi:hypothetical protein
MEGLVDVSEIVDQQAESVGLASLFVVLDVVHDRCVNEGVLVAWGSAEPVNNPGDSNRDVLGILNEVGIVVDRVALVQVGDVDEVPVGLPAATLVLDHVSEGSCLHEDVVSLAAGNVLTRHHLEEILGLGESLRALLDQLIISHSGNYTEI